MQPRGSSLGCGRMPSGCSLAARSASASCGHVVDHGVQHQVSTCQRALGVGVRVQRAGRLHHAGQQRGLLPVQLGGVDAEVGLRGVLNAERAVAERHQVQVAGEDLRLGERLVQRQRHPDLAQLAGGRGLDGGALLGVGLRDHQQLVVLHVLLLEGRAAAGVEVARTGSRTGRSACPASRRRCARQTACPRSRRSPASWCWRSGRWAPRTGAGVQPGDGLPLASTIVDTAAPRPRRAAPSRWRPRRRRGWTSARTRRRPGNIRRRGDHAGQQGSTRRA